jgi:hypothetical protein
VLVPTVHSSTVSDHCGSSLIRYERLVNDLSDVYSFLYTRDVLVLVAATFSLIPGSDEYFAREPPYMAQAQARRLSSARATVQPTHLPITVGHNGAWPASATPHGETPPVSEFHGRGFSDGGVAFLIGRWDVRAHMTRHRPLERAPGGGPPHQPLSLHTFNQNRNAFCTLVRPPCRPKRPSTLCPALLPHAQHTLSPACVTYVALCRFVSLLSFVPRVSHVCGPLCWWCRWPWCA